MTQLQMDDKENVDPDPKANKPSRSSRPPSSTKRWKSKKNVTFEPPSKSYLDRLPAEILDMICEELWDEDIPALRLQCRYLCKIATAHLLRCVFVRFKKTSIDSLLQLSSHPLLSQNVQTITYEPNLLERRSRQAWEKDIPLRDYHETSHIPAPPKQSASEREWRLYHRSLRKAVHQYDRKPYSPQELDAAWPIYQKYLQEQEDLIIRDNACQDLSRAVQRFPNLSAIHVNFGFGLWCGTGWSADTSVNPYGDGLCQAFSTAHGYREAPGVEQIVSLIKMLDTVGVKLASLRIGNLSWRFFLQYEEDYVGNSDLFYAIKRIVQSLRDIKLVITTWSSLVNDDDDGDDQEVQEYSEVEECRTYLDRGSLGRLLSGAQDLHKLAIEFDAYEVKCPIDFQYLVLDTHWSHLHTIELDSVDAHEDDWIKFFERHATNLKDVSFATIRLLDGKWPDVLERMQQLLSLEEAHFDKDLCGVAPNQMWRLDPPGYTSSKDDSVQENRTRWALENFMVNGGVCPLRDEEAHPQSSSWYF